MKTTITLTSEHIAKLREHRFLSKWYRNPADFDTDPVGWLKPGLHLTFARSIRIEPYAAIYAGGYVPSKGASRSHGLCSIGSQSYAWSPLPEAMKVGRFCSIAENLRILDSQHPIDQLSTSHFTHKRSALVGLALQDAGAAIIQAPAPRSKPYPVVGNDVWIGQNVTLAMGIVIGDGAIVAANSVVTRDVAPYAVVAGAPATFKKFRFDETLVAELLELRWWDYDFTGFGTLPLGDPAAVVRGFSAIDPPRYDPKPLILPEDFT